VCEYSSVWPEICRVLSQIKWRFLGGISLNYYSGRIFQKFFKTKAILYRNLWNSGLIDAILFWVRFAPKKIHTSTFVCSLHPGKEHVDKRITKRRCGEERPGRFVFGKTVLFTLGLGITTAYSLNILVWNFYQTSVTVSIEFWLRFEPQIRPTRLVIIFLFVTARAERKVRLCAKLFAFFRGWILIRLTWNLSHFVPNSVEILGWNFRKKLFRENFSKILWKSRLSSTETCEIPA